MRGQLTEPRPSVQVVYTYGAMAPGKRDAVAAAVAAHHLALAHGRATQGFRAVGDGRPDRTGPPPGPGLPG